MNVLKCEMCGSNELVKQDGLYVCQRCGTKYSVEEARKLMIEGTVDVQGTVKVDSSADLQNLLNLAKNAIAASNGEESLSYANKALELDSKNAEAWLLKMHAVSLTAILKDLKCSEVLAAGRKAMEFDSSAEMKEQVELFFLNKCLDDLKFCMTQLQNTDTVKRLYEANLQVNFMKATEETLAADTILDCTMNQEDSILALRYAVIDSDVSENEEYTRMVGEIAKQWVYYQNAINNRFKVMGTNMNDTAMARYTASLKRIKQGLPDEKKDIIDEKSLDNSEQKIKAWEVIGAIVAIVLLILWIAL